MITNELDKLDKTKTYYVKFYTGEIVDIHYHIDAWMFEDKLRGVAQGYQYEVSPKAIDEILTKEKYPELYL